MEYLALMIIFAWIGLTSLLGAIVLAKKAGKLASVETWFVAGRGLGLLILWLSLGANIYSAYTFLGLPGLAAREGVKAWAITLYGMLSYMIGYMIVPRIWSKAKERKWLTIADAFEDLYQSKLIGAFVAITGALWSIPYIQLQIQGIGYIIEVAGYGLIDPTTAKIIAFTLIATFTIIGGLLSIAFINALQGAIMLISIWVIGILAPIIAFGSITNLFNTLTTFEHTKPPDAKFHMLLTPTDMGWFVTLLFTAPLAFWLWPNRIQNIFGGRDVRTVKRNMVLVGLYQISQIPVILVGLTALGLYIKGLITDKIYIKPYSDMSFMLVTRTLFPPWLVGLIGAGALAASISTAAAILHVSGALFSRNAYQRLFKPHASGRELLFAARFFTLVIAILSLILALYAPDILIYLLLVGYAGILQFFPQFIIGLKKPGLLHKYTALAGMSAGMATVAYIKAILRKAPYGLYEGFYGLIINLLVIGTGVLIQSILYKKRKT